MNKLKRLVWIGLLLGGSGCNRFADQQPTPDSGPPATTVQSLTQQYPQAQDILFTTLVPNQLWQATFTQQGQHYQALTSPTQLLTADQLIDGTLPDSLTRLLEPTALAGGRLNNPRIRRYNGWYTNPAMSGLPEYVYADYTWQQQAYTASWNILRPATGKPYYNLELLPFQQAAYETKTLTDLPEQVQTVLREQSLTFTYARIQMDASQKRQYIVSANRQNQYWQLTYDSNGQLLAANNPATAQLLQQIDQLPPAIQQYLQRPELAGFDLNRGSALYGYTGHHTYGSLGTYQVSMLKNNQGWLLLFSDQGQLISRSFLTVGNF